jgi:SAM-dependent methyltransferase
MLTAVRKKVVEIHRVQRANRLKEFLLNGKMNPRQLDRMLGIHTEELNPLFSHAASPKGINKDSILYAPTPSDMLGLFLRMVKMQHSDVLYDIGCGKGLVCFASSPLVKRVVGIDHNPKIIEAANRNLEGFSRGRYGEFADRIEFRSCDAAKIYPEDILDGTVYYLFRPFGDRTFAAFSNSLKRSLAIRPRPVKVFYLGVYDHAEARYLKWLKLICMPFNQPVALFANDLALEEQQPRLAL